MAVKISRVHVWAAGMQDRPGGLADKLEPLAAAGANLEFAIARRAPQKPGAVVFVTPLKGAAQFKAARAAGFAVTKSLHSVRVEGLDKKGLGARLTRALADAEISLRGLSAAVLKGRFILYLALDTDADAAKAMRILKKMP